MIMSNIRIPDDVIEELKRIAPMLGFSGYQALIKSYIGQGLPKTWNTWKAAWKFQLN